MTSMTIALQNTVILTATVHLLEVVMDTFHQSGVDEEARPQQCVHDKRMC